jgi:hypothetical protein
MPAFRKRRPMRSSRPMPLGDLLHVRARGLADVGDGVDVGNFQREKGIGGVLDEFGGIDVGDDDRRVERRVNFLHRRHGPLRADADDHPVGLHQIADGKTFAQKFGIADHVKFHLGRAIAFDGFGDLFAGLDRHGAFVHDNFISRHGGGNVARDFFDEAQIHRTVRLRRRGHGDENHVGFLDALGGAAGERQPSGGDIFLHEFFESRLINRDAAGLEQFDLGRVVVHAHDLMPDFGEAGAGDQADVTRADEGELHGSVVWLERSRRSG